MINAKVLIIVAGIIAAAATTFSALAEPLALERDVKLRAKGEVFSQTVCLSDLVEEGWIASRCAIDKALCCRWNMGGVLSRTFNRNGLQRELNKISLGGISLNLQGAEEIAITQTHRELTANEISAKIIAAAAAKLGEDTSRISVGSIKMQGLAHVSLSSESDWDVVLPDPIVESGSVKIISTRDGAATLGWAQVSLRLEDNLYVAKKTIHPNEPIKVEDFELRKSNILATQPAVNGVTSFRSKQFPEGVRARLTILSGTPLLSNAIERVPSVKLGDTVTLILRSDNLKISTKGIVQGSAAIGDMVTVQLSRYNRTFRGRLIDGRLVEVWL